MLQVIVATAGLLSLSYPSPDATQTMRVPTNAGLMTKLGVIAKLDRVPVRRVVREFGLPAPCERASCGLTPVDGRDPGAVISLSQDREGFVLNISRDQGECLSAASVLKRFPVARMVTEYVGMAAGGYAPLYRIKLQRPWGILMFSLRAATARCVSSVTINTTPTFQQRPANRSRSASS